MRTNPVYDTLQFFLGSQPDEFALGGWRWLVVTVFVANLWIGLYRNSGERPWNYVFLALLMGGFSLHAVGRSLGLDAILRRQATRERPRFQAGAHLHECELRRN